LALLASWRSWRPSSAPHAYTATMTQALSRRRVAERKEQNGNARQERQDGRQVRQDIKNFKNNLGG